LCGKKLRLILLRLNSLHSDELELHHLHLQRLCLNMIGLGSEGGAEGAHVGVNVPLLLLHEAIVGSIDSCGHGHSPVDIHKHILGILALVVFVWKDGRLEARGNAGDVEGCAWGSGVRDTGSRANTAGAKTGEQGGAVGGSRCISGHLGRLKDRK
jgi:hypothetical protein